MKSSVERLENIRKQLTTFTRIPAVVGSKLTEKQKKQCATRWYRNFGNVNTMGCFMSHRKTWKKIVENNDRYALIMEDDCQLVPDFDSKLDKVLDELTHRNPHWDFLYCGYFGAAKRDKSYTPLQYIIKSVLPNIPQKPCDNRYSFIPECPIGLHCYIVSQKGARKLIKYMKMIDNHVDVMFLKYAKFFNVYASVEQLGYQAFDDSTISPYPPSILDNLKDEYNKSCSFYLNYPLIHIKNYPITTWGITVVCIILLLVVFFLR